MIEFLTLCLDTEEGIRDLPALGVKARALHHLNYLISDPIHAFHSIGMESLCRSHAPKNFAIQKLIAAATGRNPLCRKRPPAGRVNYRNHIRGSPIRYLGRLCRRNGARPPVA